MSASPRQTEVATIAVGGGKTLTVIEVVFPDRPDEPLWDVHLDDVDLTANGSLAQYPDEEVVADLLAAAEDDGTIPGLYEVEYLIRSGVSGGNAVKMAKVIVTASDENAAGVTARTWVDEQPAARRRRPRRTDRPGRVR